jgi:hypothetical protein
MSVGNTYTVAVDRCCPLEGADEATRGVESGQEEGNVVLTVGDHRI